MLALGLIGQLTLHQKIRRKKIMKQQKGLSTRAVVATGIGAAVFLILFKFVAIPTGIPNT